MIFAPAGAGDGTITGGRCPGLWAHRVLRGVALDHGVPPLFTPPSKDPDFGVPPPPLLRDTLSSRPLITLAFTVYLLVIIVSHFKRSLGRFLKIGIVGSHIIVMRPLGRAAGDRAVTRSYMCALANNALMGYTATC